MNNLSFFDSNFQEISSQKLFGLCDDDPPPHKPAYLDEHNGNKWIAVVNNEKRFSVRFVAIDNSNIEFRHEDGTLDKRCDGMLEFNDTIIFVELTTRSDNQWRQEKREQLRTTIKYFEDSIDAERYSVKQAYIANCKRPKFIRSYVTMANAFEKETGYVLRIMNRIEI